MGMAIIGDKCGVIFAVACAAITLNVGFEMRAVHGGV